MKLFIIAGEASGDALGARLIRALKARAAFELQGIGGPQMEAEGLKSQFPYGELSLFGFTEIVPHIPNILRRVNETARRIAAEKPDAVITIDVPGFSLRVAKKVKQLGIPLIHFVAPTVWAYKPERAEMMAEWYDLLLLLLPFEPPYFDRVGLKNAFVGHPLVEDAAAQQPPAAIPHSLLMLPGSRRGELRRHLPIFRETLEKLNNPAITVTIPTLPHLKDAIIAATRTWPVQVKVVTEQAERLEAIRTAEVALVKSGTVALELALYNVPMIVTYRINPISAWMLRRIILVPYVNLVNLLLNRPAIPELLQEQCAPVPLAHAIKTLLENPEARKAQQQAMHEALQMIGLGQSPTPSEKAATAILEFLKGQKA